MANVIIGIDPDSKAHGVAAYVDGRLTSLGSNALIDIIEDIRGLTKEQRSNTTIHLEDVCANNATFAKSFVKNKKASTAITRSVGKCQQAQIELERVFEYYGVKVVKHKISKMWKNKTGKKQFEIVTGWSGRSNEDTRSAAYFGWLGVTGK